MQSIHNRPIVVSSWAAHLYNKIYYLCETPTEVISGPLNYEDVVVIESPLLTLMVPQNANHGMQILHHTSCLFHEIMWS
jgi:hypothetical protein